jgi:hypothetical protein
MQWEVSEQDVVCECSCTRILRPLPAIHPLRSSTPASKYLFYLISFLNNGTGSIFCT